MTIVAIEKDGSLLFTDAAVHVTPSRALRGEVWTSGRVIGHAGPVERVERPDGARVIDVHGGSIVPLLVDGALRARPTEERGGYDLVPGNPATFAVTRERVGEARLRGTLIIRPADLIAVVVDGEIVAWQGEPVVEAAVDDAWVGAWADRSRGLVQHLLPEGRYTETRGGRVDAYTGACWTRGDRIVYLDDTGFWAFGVLFRDVLYHAGFVMRR